MDALAQLKGTGFVEQPSWDAARRLGAEARKQGMLVLVSHGTGSKTDRRMGRDVVGRPFCQVVGSTAHGVLPDSVIETEHLTRMEARTVGALRRFHGSDANASQAERQADQIASVNSDTETPPGDVGGIDTDPPGVIYF